MAVVKNGVSFTNCPATPVYLLGSDVAFGDIAINGDINVRPYFHEKLCDANGVEFIRVYTIDTATNKASFACDIGLDAQPYSPAEPIPNACDDSPTEDLDCKPWIASFTADDMPAIEPFDSIAVYKPDCCVVEVTTDAGSITMPSAMTVYSPEKFNCTLSTLRINGECLDQVHVFLQRTGKS